MEKNDRQRQQQGKHVLRERNLKKAMMELIFGSRGRETEGAGFWTMSSNTLNFMSKQRRQNITNIFVKHLRWFCQILWKAWKSTSWGSWPGQEADECDWHNLQPYATSLMWIILSLEEHFFTPPKKWFLGGPGWWMWLTQSDWVPPAVQPVPERHQ